MPSVSEKGLDPAEMLLCGLHLVCRVKDLLAVDDHPEEFSCLKDDVLAVLPGNRKTRRSDRIFSAFIQTEPAVDDEGLPGVELVAVGLHEHGGIVSVRRYPGRFRFDVRFLRASHDLSSRFCRIRSRTVSGLIS